MAAWFTIIICVVAGVYYLVGLLLYAWFQHIECIRKRQPFVVVVMSISSTFGGMNYIYSLLSYYDPSLTWECLYYVFIYNFLCPVWMFTLFLRCAYLVAIYSYQMGQLHRDLGTPESTKVVLFSQYEDSEKAGKPSSESRKPHPICGNESFHDEGFLLRFSSVVVQKLIKVLKMLELNYQAKSHLRKVVRITQLSILLALSVITFIQMTLLGAILMIEKWYFLYPSESIGCGAFSYLLIYLDGLFFFVLAPIFILAIRKMDDKMFIHRELSLSISVFCLAFMIYAYQTLGPDSSKFISFFRYPVWSLVICGIVTFFLSIYYPLFILLYNRWKNHSSRDLDCTEKHLNLVLSDSELKLRLREVAAKYLCLENALFLEDMWDAVHGYGAINPVYLYETYIINGSINELNIPSEVFLRLETAMENQTLVLAHFKEVEIHIKQLVLFNFFRGFINEIKNISQSH